MPKQKKQKPLQHNCPGDEPQIVRCMHDPLRTGGICLNFLLLWYAQARLKQNQTLSFHCALPATKGIWPSRYTLRKRLLSLRALKK